MTIFLVVGSTGYEHMVCYDKLDGWYCTCEDFQFRKRFCKHMKQCQSLVPGASKEVFV